MSLVHPIDLPVSQNAIAKCDRLYSLILSKTHGHRERIEGGLTWEQVKARAERENAAVTAADPYAGVGGSFGRAVWYAELETPPPPPRACACGCGVVVKGRAITASAACRKRVQRAKAA